MRAHEVSVRAVCEEHLGRIDARSDLGAFWHLDRVAALRQADLLDARLARGEEVGALAGVPVAVKDAFDVAGMPGGGGGPVAVARRDAVAVARLRRAGAVIVGKLAMHQLGWGMAGQSPGRPTCRNPLDPALQPGGSSSGSAVAVAAGLVVAALGGDSGGSVRQPAAWCRVVGYKPARAAVSRRGLLPLAPALDAVGWLTRDVEDARLLESVLTGRPLHPRSRRTDLVVGVDPAVLARCDSEIAEAASGAIRALADDGIIVRSLELPGFPARLRAIYASALASAWGETADRQPGRFGSDVKGGIAAGRAVPAAQLRHDLSTLPQRRRLAIPVDAVICPTTPTLPRRLDESDDVSRGGSLTRPFNALDWPSISVPIGALPVGLQIAVPRGSESILWALASRVAQGGDSRHAS